MTRQCLIFIVLVWMTNPLVAQTWEPLNNGLTSSSIQVLAADARTGRLYAGAIVGGAFKRSSGGVWQSVHSQFSFNTITSIAVSPTNSDVILLGTEEFGAYLSNDGGANWTSVPAGGGVAFVRKFRFSTQNALRVLAATEGEGVYQSVDGGTEWSVISVQLASDFTRDVLIHPTDSLRVISAASGIDDIPLRVSRDGGKNWNDGGVGITSTVTSLEIGATGPTVVYAGVKSGVFVSEDDGSTFESRPLLDTPVEVRAVALDPLNHLRVFAGTNKGVFFSRDAGQNWTVMNDGMPTEDIRSLILDPIDPSIIYVGTGLDGVYSTRLTLDPVVDVDADFDGSGSVDFSDFLTFVATFGLPSSNPAFDARADLDESGTVNFSDFLLFVAVFGT